jgi:hypothetical protein
VNPTAKVIAGGVVSRNCDVPGLDYIRSMLDGNTYRYHIAPLPVHEEKNVDLTFVIGRSVTGKENVVTRDLKPHVMG